LYSPLSQESQIPDALVNTAVVNLDLPDTKQENRH